MWSWLLVCKSCNNISKSTQTLIDTFTFLKPLSCCLSDPHSFTTCQIDQVEFTYLNLFDGVSTFVVVHDSHLFKNNDEDSVWSGTQVVHLGWSCGSALGTLLHQWVNFIWRSDRPFTQAFDEDSLLPVFSDLELRPLDFKKIRDYLIIYLQVTDSHHKSCIHAWLHLNKFEYFFHASRNNSSLGISHLVLEPFHRVGFSCSCLTVCNYSWVVALKNWNNTVFGCVVIHKFLSWKWIINIIKCEVLPHTQVRVHCDVLLFFLFGDFSSQVLHDCHWLAILSNLHDWSEVTSRNFFSLQWWSNPNTYFKVLSRWASRNTGSRSLRLIEQILLILLLLAHRILLLVLNHKSHVSWAFVAYTHLVKPSTHTILWLIRHIVLVILLLLLAMLHLAHIDAHVHIHVWFWNIKGRIFK